MCVPGTLEVIIALPARRVRPGAGIIFQRWKYFAWLDFSLAAATCFRSAPALITQLSTTVLG
jgi:hypothetical protein